MLIGKNFVFVHIPKNAGTFIRSFLEKSGLGISTSQWHIPISEIPIDNKNKQIVTSIRNPLDYYISLYEYQRHKPNRKNDRWYNFWSPRDLKFTDFIKVMLTDNDKLKDTNMDLAMGNNPYRPVFKWMIKNDIGFYTLRYLYMLLPKYDTLDDGSVFSNHDEILTINSVLKCEKLIDDMISVFALNNKQILHLKQTKKINSSVRKDNLEDYYNEETKNIVEYKDRFILDKYYNKIDQKQYKDSQEEITVKNDDVRHIKRNKELINYLLKYSINVKSILDVGCRECLAYDILKDKDIKCMGVDISEQSVEFAKSKGRDVIRGDLHFLSNVIEKRFDAVISVHSLEHCYDPLKALKECYKCINSMGHIAIRVPIQKDISKQKAHYVTFTPSKLRKLLIRAGFVKLFSKSINLNTKYEEFIIIGRKTS